jgi:hypothetical protein
MPTSEAKKDASSPSAPNDGVPRVNLPESTEAPSVQEEGTLPTVFINYLIFCMTNVFLCMVVGRLQWLWYQLEFSNRAEFIACSFSSVPSFTVLVLDSGPFVEGKWVSVAGNTDACITWLITSGRYFYYRKSSDSPSPPAEVTIYS